MEKFAANRSLGMAIAALAIVQSAFGVMRALHWFDVGADLMGQGLLILPLTGVLALFRGGFIVAIALLYVAFACGMLLQRAWAFWPGLLAAAVNLLLVFSVIGQGEPVRRIIPWAVIPTIVLLYLLFQHRGHRGPG